MKKLILLIVAGTFLLSCANNNTDETQGLPVNLEQQDEVSVFDIFESIDVVPLETNAQSLIARMDKIIYFNDKYYVLDGRQQVIVCFDSAGKFLFKIARKGQGPEEYLYLGDFNIDPYNNQLLLIEPFGSLLAFDLDGRFVSKTRLPNEIRAYNDVYPLDKNRLVFSSLHNYELVFYDRTENAITDQRYGMEDDKLRGGPFAPLNRLYSYNNNLFFSPRPSNDIINLSDSSIFSWNFGKLTNTKKTIEELKKYILQSKTNFSANDGPYDWVGMKKLNNTTYYNAETSRYKLCALQCAQSLLRHVFYDKKTGKTLVFDKTKEGICFLIANICDESIIMYEKGGRVYNQYITLANAYYHPDTFTEAQKQLLQSRKDDDNPFIVKYNFKK